MKKASSSTNIVDDLSSIFGGRFMCTIYFLLMQNLLDFLSLSTYKSSFCLLSSMIWSCSIIIWRVSGNWRGNWRKTKSQVGTPPEDSGACGMYYCILLLDLISSSFHVERIGEQCTLFKPIWHWIYVEVCTFSRFFLIVFVTNNHYHFTPG